MKKLLSLILVLGMVGMATAGLRTLQFESGGNAVSVFSDSGEAYNVMLLYTPTLNAAVVLTPKALAGNKSYLVDYDVVDSADLGLALGMVRAWEINVASTQVGVIQPGVHAIATFEGIELGNIDMGAGRIDLVDSTTLDILGTAFVVPEPASMLLLGLGGLFLRRK